MSFNEYVKTFQLKIELGLERMYALLEELGNPHENIKLVHVSGTNGKGSVCAFLEPMFIASGARVGMYSSPELYKKNEVIRLNGENISDTDLDALIESTKTACDAVNEKIGSYPSQFEIITACAFLYFKKKSADIVIMEVGMGGEGDATNVCKNTKAAVITKISLDHTQYLGDTIEKIAEVKSGIIKKGCKAVTTKENFAVMDILSDKCKKCGADLSVAESFESVGFEEIYEKIRFGGEVIKLSLGGINQLQNAAVAVKTAQVLNLCGKSIKYGLENAVHRGRLEKISDNFYFDGAHNKDGVSALAESIKRYFTGKKIICLMGSMKDKDVESALKILKPLVSEFKFVTVNVEGRALSAAELLKLSKEIGLNAGAYDRLTAAYDSAMNEADENTVVIACGSLYFYKDFKNEKIF